MKKDKLLCLLKSDDDIIEAIKSIFQPNRETVKYNEEVELIPSRIKEQEIEINNLKEINQKLANEKNMIEKELLEKEEMLCFYKNTFEKELLIYNLYQNLNLNTKDSLRGIFKIDSFVGFLTCGVQQNNIESFWDYIQNELRENINNELKSLITIFDFLFDKFSLIYQYYRRQEIEENQNFDTEYHIKHNSSQNQSGKILEVLFYGYQNTNTNQVIKQSVVRI